MPQTLQTKEFQDQHAETFLSPSPLSTTSIPPLDNSQSAFSPNLETKDDRCQRIGGFSSQEKMTPRNGDLPSTLSGFHCDKPFTSLPVADNKNLSSFRHGSSAFGEVSTTIDFSGICQCSESVSRPAAIASVETLTPSSTPRSNTLSNVEPSSHVLAEATLHSIPCSDVMKRQKLPQHEWVPCVNVFCEDKVLVRRSWSLVESSALASSKKFHHKKSPSHGGVPFHACPLDEPCQGLRIQLAGLEIKADLCCSHNEKGTTQISGEDVESNSGPEMRRKRWPWSFSSGIGEPSVYHALVVIFLEFFAWGLLTSPMILVLKDTFPDHTFLMNGIIMGIKGILSFLSAPLVGALSDVWGRKFFLFITVFFTCLPIPFMKINTWWYFALISMSGVFAVTYSIIFAYVADVTDPAERHHAYGLVSATFAASLVTSPALGAYLSQVHSDDLVVGLATAIAVLDIFFILVAVPESLPEKLRLSNTNTWSTQISWEQADPFSTLWKVSKDKNILLISITVFLSYLPEAGQMSCFFVYLQLVMGFQPEMVATFIAVVGILSVIAQTALLGLLIKSFSNKTVISIGLVFELLQLMWYGFGSQAWMMWAAGVLASVSSITYPAISSYVSTHTDVDKQGVAQGIVTGMRGLCAGLGPAVFGFIFYLFHVDLNQDNSENDQNSELPVPGPPFVFGAMLVLLALTVSAFIPESSPSKSRKQSVNAAIDIGYNRDHKKSDSLDGTSQPLMTETGVL